MEKLEARVPIREVISQPATVTNVVERVTRTNGSL